MAESFEHTYEHKQVSIGFVVSSALERRNVSWRKCGLDGRMRRPIFHRFDIKGGFTMLDVMTESIIKSNSLFRKLSRK